MTEKEQLRRLKAFVNDFISEVESGAVITQGLGFWLLTQHKLIRNDYKKADWLKDGDEDAMEKV